MKFTALLVICLFSALCSCGGHSSQVASSLPNEADTLRISHPDIEYDIVIIDPGFQSWFVRHAKPRGHYSQPYLEARNALWVQEWNLRVGQPQRFGNLYTMHIDYRPGTDYGYEVNYMLFNYLTYFQMETGQRLGSFEPHY